MEILFGMKAKREMPGRQFDYRPRLMPRWATLSVAVGVHLRTNLWIISSNAVRISNMKWENAVTDTNELCSERTYNSLNVEHKQYDNAVMVTLLLLWRRIIPQSTIHTS